jgi:hypothetical protein
MTPNKSLELSCRIQEAMSKDLLQFIYPIFPVAVVKDCVAKFSAGSRDRIFTAENTLLTMVITSLHEDKSLQNSVNIFQEIFQKNRETIILEETHRVEQKRLESIGKEVQAGRPNLFKVKLPASKMKDISSNTAAFSKARGRVELGVINEVFKATTKYDEMQCVKKWHGRTVYNTDGTFFQMQDTVEIPETYRVQKNQTGELQGYPQGLLQVLTQHGSGFVASYKIAGRQESELRVVPELINELPSKSLLLADDLYNCYAFFCLLQDKGIEVIVPDKKDRPYRVIKKLDVGDELVEIKKPQRTPVLIEGQIIPKTIILRRITYRDTENPEKMHVLLTTLFDESIPAMEIVLQYTHRWDIEITIREVKTLMGMNIARSKSEEMVFKEFGVALIAYNLIRRVVAKSVEKTDFSPEADIFQKLFAPYKNTLVDRKGRVYSRWAPGRPSANNSKNKAPSNSEQTGKTLSSDNKGREISKI